MLKRKGPTETPLPKGKKKYIREAISLAEARGVESPTESIDLLSKLPEGPMQIIFEFDH